MAKLDPIRLRIAVRASLACGLALLIPENAWVQHQWVMVSVAILVTSEPRWGALVQKSWARILGTIAGGLPALAVGLLAPTHPWLAATCLILVIATATYWGVTLYQANPAATLAVVTACMLYGNPSHDWRLALQRLGSVGLGAVLALLCVQVVFPLRSRQALQMAVMDCLQLLKTYAQALRAEQDPGPQVGAAILANLSLQQRLIQEARLESRQFPTSARVANWDLLRATFRYLQLIALSGGGPNMQPVLDTLDALIASGGPGLHNDAESVARLPAPDSASLDFCYTRLQVTLEALKA